ncbi:MAG: hypothetical protein IT480_13675 [Gammaproteobacteria bacterium]|nr:hypothetical protein [Gammaproteobacteria bacterium]
MPNRREVVLAGLAGGALAAAPAVLRGAGVPPVAAAGAAPYRVIIDERFAATGLLADAARARRWSVSPIHGDVTAVWYEELAPRWRAGPAPIVGMTTAAALFCLERRAWDARLRVNLRIDHRGDRNGRVQHALAAQPGLITRQALSGLARPAFATLLPNLLVRAMHAARGAPETHALAAAAGSLAPPWDAWLVSWSIGTRVPVRA